LKTMGNIIAGERALAQLHSLLAFCVSTEEEAEEFFGYQAVEHAMPDIPESIKVNVCVNVLHNTLQFYLKNDDPNFCKVSFSFDALVPCTIEVYSNAMESSSGSLLVTKSFPKGYNQHFTFSEEEPWVDIREISENNYLFIIVIKANKVSNNFEAHSLITCCSISNNNIEEITSIQKIKYKDKVYVTKDIFGLEYESLLEDCAICLSERKDTVILPCRHLCVCHSCAQVLKLSTNKCPICRAVIRAVLVGTTTFHKIEKYVEEKGKKNDEIDLISKLEKNQEIEIDRSYFKSDFTHTNSVPSNLSNDEESLLNVIDVGDYKNSDDDDDSVQEI